MASKPKASEALNYSYTIYLCCARLINAINTILAGRGGDSPHQGLPVLPLRVPEQSRGA